jgi:hypothetical protein
MEQTDSYIQSPSMRLSDVVSSFCLSSFNDKRKHYNNYLEHAKWIWKKFFWNTIWAIKSKYVKVDKTVYPYRIPIPKGMVRFINITVEDERGNLRELWYDQNMNTLTVPNISKPACSVCGQVDELADCLRSVTVTTRDIVIGGQTFTERIWNELCKNGDVQEIRETPTQDFIDTRNWNVTYVINRRTISTLAIKPCGCIVNSPENILKIVEECKCGTPLFNMSVPVLAEPYQQFGKIKITDGYIYMKGNVPDSVILAWQTNGEDCDAEIMVPEFAVDYMHFGMRWRANALSINVPFQIEKRSRINFEQMELDLSAFLDPIRVEEFMNSQMAIPKWGGVSSDLLEWCGELPPVTPKAVVAVTAPAPTAPASSSSASGSTQSQFLGYWGWLDTAPTSQGQITSLQRFGLFNKTMNAFVDFTQNSLPKILVYAEPSDEPLKTQVHGGDSFVSNMGAGEVFSNILIGSFRVYYTNFKTQNTQTIFEFRKP